MGKDDELILGLPRERLLGGPDWRGLRQEGIGPYLEAIERHGEHRRRGDVEEDPSWKQVIPYLLLHDAECWFLMRRTRAGGDARLHERYSVGVGGHVRPEDGGIAGGLAREWHEEIEAAFEPEFRLVGLLNDDDDPVGAVHFGVVFVAAADGRPVAVRERDKLEGSFEPLWRVRQVYDRLETWSQLVVDALSEGGGTVPSRRIPDPAEAVR
jgi:predicted NUDIX family phosphoesterase